jgi:hypothetical protein
MKPAPVLPEKPHPTIGRGQPQNDQADQSETPDGEISAPGQLMDHGIKLETLVLDIEAKVGEPVAHGGNT